MIKINTKVICILTILFFGFDAISQNVGISQDRQDQEKEVRIKNNPDSYIRKGGNIDAETRVEKDKDIVNKDFIIHRYNDNNNQNEPLKNKNMNEIKAFPNNNSFPVYVNTGNRQLDNENYYSEKEMWIQNNPTKYQKLIIKEKISETPSQIRARELNSITH